MTACISFLKAFVQKYKNNSCNHDRPGVDSGSGDGVSYSQQGDFFL